MKTEELIDNLAADLRPVGRYDVEFRAFGALGLGIVAALGVLALWLGFRPDFVQALATASFWMKLGYPLAVALAAQALACRLVRPACGTRANWWLAAAPFAIVIGMGIVDIIRTPAPDRLALWLGSSWAACPIRILLLSLPAFVAALWTFRRFAPTRLRLAGFAAGLVAGGAGAFVYALTCTETSAPFLATWYTLGILSAGALGALVGPRALRW